MDLLNAIGIILGLFAAVSLYFIMLKLGYNPFVSALIIVPVVNLIFIIIVALKTSPVEAELEALKQKYEPNVESTISNDFEDDGQELSEIQVCHYCKTENPPGIEKCIVCGCKLTTESDN